MFISFDFISALKPADEVSSILHSKLVKYNRNLRPNYGEESVSVGISLEIIRVLDISDINMDFTVQMEFKQSWKDSRLSFENGESVIKEIGVGTEFAKNFWVPDTFFANEKLSSIPKHTTDSEMFLKVQSSGTIILSRRMTVTASCEMTLHHFPLDCQVCSLEMASLGHFVKDIELGWLAGNDSVIMLSPDMPNYLFTVGSVRLREKKVKLLSGIYKTLLVDISVKRKWGYFVKSFYVPVGVSVILSWMAFLIPPHHVTARVILGLGMLCSVVLLEIQAAGMTASVAYLTAGDLYGGGCCVLIIMSLLVSGVASCVTSGEKRNGKHKNIEGKSKRLLRCLQARCIDLLSCLVFPVLGAVLGIKYWELFEIEKLDTGL
eukprot:GFUD01000196.1.p1 GENE.GFUD01000196.1~~GFUD01000196.1.p1  ORF type:complete len:411 (+),score=104.72 GFUD01000196.1:103-1233(+)